MRAESPVGLAALRIAIAVAILISPELWQAPRWAALPPSLRFAPAGLGWALGVVPIDVGLARTAQAVLIACCAAAILGAGARLAMAGVTLSGLYVFGLAQLSGAVIHDMHLFWFSSLLAVSPCGDALRGVRPRQTVLAASPAYGLPLQIVRVLLGIVYFFPGFWKLATSGLAWITSDNLRNQIYWKWYQLGLDPPALRIDQLPWLLQLLALAVVVFELGFIALIWTPRSRLWAAGFGVAFHVGTQWFMGVTFVSLLACYVVLLDWDAITRAVGRPTALRSAADEQPAALPALLIGLALIAVTAVQGARGAVQAWPFGCYPTFDRIVGDSIGDLRIEALHADGRSIAVPDGPSTRGRPRSPQDWARAWRLAGLYGDRPDHAQLQGYFARLRRDPQVANAAAGAVRLRFYAATYSVLPEHRGGPPLSKHLLAELALR